MNRGRPAENTERRTKYVLEFIEVPSKPELGGRQLWHFDDDKNKHGAWKVESFPGPDEKKFKGKIKIDKNQTYGKMPVVLVFNTSKRSNAKTKMKVWRNTNIDYINSAVKLPGVPEKAEILHLAVGESFIEKYKQEYNL
jgi:hypothetical protein